MEEKSYGLNSTEKLEQQCMDELMQAIETKNVAKFRQALEALVMSCFEDDEQEPFDGTR